MGWRWGPAPKPQTHRYPTLEPYQIPTEKELYLIIALVVTVSISLLNHLWSSSVPIGLNRHANKNKLWWCNNDPIRQWQFCQLLLLICKRKVLNQRAALQTRCTDVNSFERVKERRHSTAESLTLFSNDWFNLLVLCGIIYSYNLHDIGLLNNVCRSFPH